MLKRLTLLFLVLFPLAASAQTTSTAMRTFTTVNSTISVTNTFQSALATFVNRGGCSIQNQGSNIMRIYVGTLAAATVSKMQYIQPGQTWDCVPANKSQINITGTAGDAFTVVSW